MVYVVHAVMVPEWLLTRSVMLAAYVCVCVCVCVQCCLHHITVLCQSFFLSGDRALWLKSAVYIQGVYNSWKC